MTSIECNTVQSFGLRDHLLQDSPKVFFFKEKIVRALRVAVLDRQPATVRDVHECFQLSVDGDSIVCATVGGSDEFIISDDSLRVPHWNRYYWRNPLECIMPLVHRCLGAPIRHVPQGWQTTGSVMLEKQSLTGGALTIAFKHRLSELGIPAWMPPDTHPLTRHLVGVADNLAEVDPVLSGDPRVFAKRAFEVFGDDIEFIFAAAMDRRQPVGYMSSCWFNSTFRRAALERYRDDKMARPYMYSK